MHQVDNIGDMGGETEVRAFCSGKKVLRFSLAVNGYSKGGKARPATWMPCATWGDVVERLGKCCQEGKLSGRRVQIAGLLVLNECGREVGDRATRERKLGVEV